MRHVLDVMTGGTTVPLSLSKAEEIKLVTDAKTSSVIKENNKFRLYTLDTECKMCPIKCLIIAVPFTIIECVNTHFTL